MSIVTFLWGSKIIFHDVQSGKLSHFQKKLVTFHKKTLISKFIAKNLTVNK